MLPLWFVLIFCFLGSILGGAITSLNAVVLSSIAAAVVIGIIAVRFLVKGETSTLAACLFYVLAVDICGWWLGLLIHHLRFA